MLPQAIALLFVAGALPVSAIPRFNIDLDKAPEQRWKHVTQYYKVEMAAILKALNKQLDRNLGGYKAKFLQAGKWDPVYEAELQGIVQEAESKDVTVDSLKAFNMLYEMQSPVACSGVLWATPNGTVLHGRNFDFALHFNMPDKSEKDLKAAVFEAVFWKEGRPLFIEVNHPGLIGIHTGMRFGGWSLQQNTRTHANNWRQNLEATEQGGEIYGLATRRIMETVPDFHSAALQLYATKFAAPQYLVLSGSRPYEGAVLTIDRLGQHLSGTPGIQSLGPSATHLVQTNDDLLAKPADKRRPVAMNLLQQMVPKTVANEENLLQFMHTTRLLNKVTVFSTVMVPATGYFKSILPNEAPFPLDGDALLKGKDGTFTGFHEPAYESDGLGHDPEGFFYNSPAKEFELEEYVAHTTNVANAPGGFEAANDGEDFTDFLSLSQASSSVHPEMPRPEKIRRFLEKRKKDDSLSLMQLALKFEV